MNDTSAHSGALEESSGRRPIERSSEPGLHRLRPFRFLLSRAEELLEVTFYAATDRDAEKLATSWAVARGWGIEGHA